MTYKEFLLISLILLFIHLCYGQSCKDDVIAVKGYKYDLKALRDLGTMTEMIDRAQYSFVICGRHRDRCGEEECKDNNEFSACVADVFDDFCIGLASAGSDKFDADNGVLKITHGNGDKFRDACFENKRSEVRYEIKCNEEATGTPKLDISFPQCPSSDYAVVVKFEHKAGCPIGKAKKLSAGSVMLIIIFVGIAVYLIAGISINAFAREKRGIEMVPNLEFWKGMPGLIKDGFNFMICRNTEKYEPIK